MYFLTLWYFQRQNFGASETVLCHVQLNFSSSGSCVEALRESEVITLWWQRVKGARVITVKDLLLRLISVSREVDIFVSGSICIEL